MIGYKAVRLLLQKEKKAVITHFPLIVTSSKSKKKKLIIGKSKISEKTASFSLSAHPHPYGAQASRRPLMSGFE